MSGEAGGYYPVLFGQSEEFYEARRTHTVYPRGVPRALVAGHEAQAKKNHYQTLAQLEARGGLSPLELWAVVHDVDYYVARKTHDMTEAKAIAWLRTVEGVGWQIPG